MEYQRPTIEVDEDANAVYISFTDNEIVRTEVVTDQSLIDYDDKNEIVGVELIDAVEAFIPTP